jgi:hypothetical protein
MIRVTVEIVPFGLESIKRHIGTVEIARTSMRNDPEDYTWNYYRHDGCFCDNGHVRSHSYRDGAWDLIRRALECLIMPDVR